MTEPTKAAPLSIDLAKVNQYGLGEDQLGELQQAQKDIIQSLEQRYRDPNWFKVSAGFLKPQLGGFAASLGSAAEAMGENVEKQRDVQMPIAQMRAQLAQSNILMGQNRGVSDEIKAWYADPKNANKLPPASMAADWRARAPDAAAVKSMDTQIGLQQKEIEQALQRIKTARDLQQTPSDADLRAAGMTPPPPAIDREVPKETEVKADIPLNPNDVKPGQKVDFGFAPIPQQNLMTASGLEKVKEDEAKASKVFDMVEEFGHKNFSQYTQNIDQLLNYAHKGEKERSLLRNVTNKMASDTPLISALLAAGNEGLHANLNGYSANVGAPIKDFLNNLTDKEERRVAQMLVLALDNANYAQTQLKGGLKGGLPVSEANVLTAGLLSRDLDYNVMMNGMLQLDNSFNMYKNFYDGQRALRRKYANELTAQAPNYQIYNSDWYNNTFNHYTNRAKEISKRYNASLSGQ